MAEQVLMVPDFSQRPRTGSAENESDGLLEI
jgi:hypothetical protein